MLTPADHDYETLASFVPARLVRRFASNPAPLTAPETETCEAAVLFADISGFSPLADRLALRGPAGAEELTAILTVCFDRLISVIHDHGGDVMKFAGDALLALWEAPAQDLETATSRAAQCALAVRAALHDYEVSDGSRLSIHSAVGAGEVTIASVGGQQQRWELLVSGSPLIQIGLAGKQAAVGEVVVAGAAWVHLSGRARGVPLKSGDWRLEAIDFPAPPAPPSPARPGAEAGAALRACVPRAVLARLGAGQDAWLAELRNLTILFVNLPDLNETLPLKRAQAVMSAMQSALYRFEGSVNELGSDDKGITLVAALGLPPLAHEDDALRAVQAAQAIQARLRELGIRSAIGITTGRVYCGALGNARRRQYAIIGDVVNLAARLMQIAPGDILCDAATHRATAAKIRFEPLPPQKVKGKAHPVPLFRPYCQAPESTGRGSMFGRETERGILSSALDALQAARGGVILIEGEAGIGKSRLVADFSAGAETRDTAVHAGMGDAIERSTPYHAWRALFNRLFALDGLTTAEERRVQVCAQLAADPHAAARAPLLQSVLSLDLRDNELTGGMNGQVRADNTNDLLLRVLRTASAARPTLLVLEDAHWFDSASWALALLVSQQVPSVLMVVTTRPLAESNSAELRSFIDEAKPRHLRLDALPTATIGELVSARLGVSTLPPDVAAFIQEKTQGNPFFAEELALALRDGGLLVTDENTCRLAPGVDLKTVSFPDSVQAVITSRIDRLPPSQQLTLKVASVIGRVFAMRILRDIYPIEPDRSNLPEHLRMLDRLEFTPLESAEPDLAYIFKHVITQEVAYNLMLFAHRRQLHRTVAEWYEHTQTGDLAPFFPLLAHHWQRAEDSARAQGYLAKAGEQALRGGAYAEAVEFLLGCVELGNRAGENSTSGRASLVRWERQLGEGYLGLGALEKSREHSERALALLHFPTPRKGLRLLLSVLSQAAVQAAHRLFPRAFLKASADERAMCREAAVAYERIGHVCYYTGDLPVGVNSALRVLNLAENAGSAAELARGYAAMSMATAFKGQHRLARIYGLRSRANLPEVGDRAARSFVHEMLGVVHAGNGEWERARADYSEAIALAEEIGDRRRWEETMIQLAVMENHRGDFAGSLALAERLLADARRFDHRHAESWGAWGKAVNLIQMGNAAAALEFFARTETLRGSDLGSAEAIWLYGGIALAHRLLGDDPQAVLMAGRAVAIIRRTQAMADSQLNGYSAVAQVYLELWEQNGREYESRALEVCAALRRLVVAFPVGQPRALLYKGCAKWLSGRRASARRSWKRTLATAAQMAMPYEEGLAHYELGRHLPPGDPARTQHLAAARELFEKLGARYDLERTRTLAD